jgi:hypothetical protein
MELARVLYISQASTTDGKKWLVTTETQTGRSLFERIDRKRMSILKWYRILRVQHEWKVFQAIRFALWLAR